VTTASDGTLTCTPLTCTPLTCTSLTRTPKASDHWHRGLIAARRAGTEETAR
jgi:hypothetical protein